MCRKKNDGNNVKKGVFTHACILVMIDAYLHTGWSYHDFFLPYAHCVPFLMNSLKSNAAQCDTGPIKAGERIREKLSRGHIYRLMVPYLFCLSRIVISLPRSSSSWQMCGWHIWVAKTRGVLPSCIKDTQWPQSTHSHTRNTHHTLHVYHL